RRGDVYKQLNAAFGTFAMDTLKASTKALASGSAADDSVYTTIEDQIGSLTAARDSLAGEIKTALSHAAFDNQALDEQQARSWIDQANDLLSKAQALASS